MPGKPRAELKITWERFIEAALDRLSEKYPTISLNRQDNVRFVRNLSYEGECAVAETPEHVYIELEGYLMPKVERESAAPPKPRRRFDWRNLLVAMHCLVFHGHTVRLIPIQTLSSATIYQRMSICPRCEKDLLEKLDEYFGGR